jgi:hypothetical protein
MDYPFRSAFNRHFSTEKYHNYLQRLESKMGQRIPFRIAETPLFLPKKLRAQIVEAAEGIVEQLIQPDLQPRLEVSIPDKYRVPNQQGLPECLQVDMAVAEDSDGQIVPRLVELQAFPSLYAFMLTQLDVLDEDLQKTPELQQDWTLLFRKASRDNYLNRLRSTIVGEEDPEHVVMMDIDPPSQKTYVDFLSTQNYLGIDPWCPSQMVREGNKLFRNKDGKRIPIKRIYNRIVFDELENKSFPMPFDYRDELDVTWIPHPNWYWMWSKYTMPFLNHHAVPETRFVSELDELPGDLENYVLKPLFSFAGSGVVIDVEPKHVQAIPEAQKKHYILQKKVKYSPLLTTPDGSGVKAEIRVMFLRTPQEKKPLITMNLVRLSRGKMLGVDQNKDLDWVGGTVGIWPQNDSFLSNYGCRLSALWGLLYQSERKPRRGLSLLCDGLPW